MSDISAIFSEGILDELEPIKPDYYLPSFDLKAEYAYSGMIDWLTLRIDISFLPADFVKTLFSFSKKIFKASHNGVLDWETFAWESIRSDTHQVCFKVGTDFQIQGSPARLGLTNNAFGSLNIVYCATKMLDFVSALFDTELPSLHQWSCSRIDITRNYLMQSGAEARQALSYLKQSPESRQKHSFESNGLYIGKRSTLHRGKIYLKGEDAKRNLRQGRALYTDLQIKQAERLLRAEYTLARHKIRRLREDEGVHWYQLSPERLLDLHTEYFKEYLSTIEVTDMGNVLERLMTVAPTEGRARAAYDCYTRIRLCGYEQTKESYNDSTWRKHIGYLKKAGFTRADLQPINVIPLKQRAIEVSQPVKHWNDIEVLSA